MNDFILSHCGKFGKWLLIITIVCSIPMFFMDFSMSAKITNLFFNIFCVYPLLFRPMEKPGNFYAYSNIVLLSCIGYSFTYYAIGYCILSAELTPIQTEGLLFLNKYMAASVACFYIIYYAYAYTKIFELRKIYKYSITAFVSIIALAVTTVYCNKLVDAFYLAHPDLLQQILQ